MPRVRAWTQVFSGRPYYEGQEKSCFQSKSLKTSKIFGCQGNHAKSIFLVTTKIVYILLFNSSYLYRMMVVCSKLHIIRKHFYFPLRCFYICWQYLHKSFIIMLVQIWQEILEILQIFLKTFSQSIFKSCVYHSHSLVWYCIVYQKYAHLFFFQIISHLYYFLCYRPLNYSVNAIYL